MHSHAEFFAWFEFWWTHTPLIYLNNFEDPYVIQID